MRKDDFGVVITLTMKDSNGNIQDISDAITKTVVMQAPDATILDRSGVFFTDGSDGKLSYTSLPNEFTQVGIWSIQGVITTSSGSYSSSVNEFRVEQNI